MSDVTLLIGRAAAGDREANDALFALVYDDLRRMAARQLRGSGDGLRTTSLVHEAYMRLARPQALDVRDRMHFFAVAARAMRQIVIDHVRARHAGKRGGGAEATSLDGLEVAGEDPVRDVQMLALDRALEQLAARDERLARLVELRFFVGMSLEEAGTAMGLSEPTLKRDWRKARAFLHGLLGEDA